MEESIVTFDMVFGIVLTVLALGAVVFLTLWSRRTIERIHTHRPASLRHIQKHVLNGKPSRNHS